MGTIKRNFSNNVTPTGKFDSADLTGTIPATNVADASLTNVTSVPASVGDLVQKVASDPSPASAGDVWYNTTSNALKSLVASQAWSSGSPLITARYDLAGAGTQTNGLAFGGSTFPGPAISSAEEYNGSGWSLGGNLGTARYGLAGAGTQTAGLGFGGYVSPGGNRNLTEEYDGTSWTAGGTLGTARRYLAGAGIQTAGLGFGGFSTTNSNATEEYDGSSWTAGGNLSTARNGLSGAGIQTAGLAISGGLSPGTTVLSSTEEYDGSAWTAGGNVNTAVRLGSGTGTQTSALKFGGGSPPLTGSTESYDGTSWTTSPATLATARANLGGSGANNTAALAFGGASPPITGVTEEYNVSTNVITAAAWSSGGNLNTARIHNRGVGPQTAAVSFSGYINVDPGALNTGSNSTEEYDGATWTSLNNLNTARGVSGKAGAGPTSAVCFAGQTGTGTFSNATEEWNGSSWTSVNNFPEVNSSLFSGGTESAAFSAGGYVAPVANQVDTTKHYDGTTWSVVPATISSIRGQGGSGGTQTAGIIFNGTSNTTITQEYDGSTWTTGGNMIVGRREPGASGTQTAMLGYSGYNPGVITSTELYDGTSWITQPNMTTGRIGPGQGMGGSTSALGAGGYIPGTGNVGTTEEFTGETSAINIVEITTS